MTQTVLLSDILYPVSDTMKFTDKDVIFLNTSDIEAGKFLHKNLSDPKTLPGQAKKKIQQNDILFSEIRPANKRFAYVDFDNTENHVVSTKLMVLRSKNIVHPKYAYHWLTAQQQLSQLQTIAESRSGTFPQITFDTIKTLKVVLPDYPEQVKIADFVDAIDEKIELNRRMNETLDQIGQALFRHYFITSPEAEKWEVVKLSDISDYISRGISPKYDEAGDSLVVNQRCIRDSRLDLANARSQSKAFTNDKLLRKGDVLINSTGVGTLGRVAQVDDIPNGITFDSHVTVVRPKINTYFFGQMMRNLKPAFEDMGSGSTGQTELSRVAVSEVKVKLPSENAIEKFSNELTPMRKKMQENDKEIQTLTTLRDTLLPRLINGKIKLQNNVTLQTLLDE